MILKCSWFKVSSRSLLEWASFTRSHSARYSYSACFPLCQWVVVPVLGEWRGGGGVGVGGCSGVVCVFRLVWWVCRLGRVHVMTALGSSGRRGWRWPVECSCWAESSLSNRWGWQAVCGRVVIDAWGAAIPVGVFSPVRRPGSMHLSSVVLAAR